ncbi:hypothetical protein [Sphingomonas sp.]|uniref:hypothetical protein n=1 Tax=Sphingomonas sp. TaxID=28214 RepID=UPI0035BC85E1
MTDDPFLPSRRGVLTTATLAAAGLAQPGRPAEPKPRGVEERLVETRRGTITDYGAVSGGGDATRAFASAFAAQSATRSYRDPAGGWWGVGRIVVPKGSYAVGPLGFGGASQLGLDLGGDAPFASTLRFDVGAAGAGLSLRTYVNVHVHDLTLHNVAATPGASVGIDLDGTGGGGNLSLKRLIVEGFGTAIRNNGDVVNGVHAPGNGDKALIEQCVFLTSVGYDRTRNNQAIGWTFLNTASGCADTTFRLSGAGETLIVNHVGDIYGSFIALPEGSGNPGTGQFNYFGARTTVMSTKLEYHGKGDRMLLDARASRLATDAGGSNCDIVFRETSIASGTAWPDPATHVIIQVGDATSGSDAIRVKQEGGTIEGVVKLGSSQLGPLSRRWSFRDAVRAPDPATVQFLGEGSHYLIEWRANENVPVDQYRGGEAFTGAIDAQKVFLWRHVGKALVNTGVEGEDHGGRKGGKFVIGGFPRKMTVTGLAVFIDHNRAGTDTLIEWFADRRFTRAIGQALIAGDRPGCARW